ncbi:MAG: antibiotic biosynthesis monooxygenase [Cellulophaga sp.]
MLVRIVKLTFKREHIEKFQQIFEDSKEAIRGTEGCCFLELYQDKGNPCLFFTYSHWNTETDLDTYRNSEFFKSVWKKTKTLFSDKPEAWSLNKMDPKNF